MKIPFRLLFLCFCIASCQPNKNEKNTVDMTPVNDAHSFAKPEEAVVKHLDLAIEVLFDDKQIHGTATYSFDKSADASSIIFDTRELDIEEVRLLPSNTTVAFTLSDEVEHLGQALTIPLSAEATQVAIQFRTRPSAEALQWLDPQQTAGKQHPFLFTQSQAILARTWLPCQDSPGIRFTYNAKVKIPTTLMATMSATNPTKKSDNGVYLFEMKQPIPSYLMALSVGNVVFQPIGQRTGVYAEPEVLPQAVYEFEEMENMLVAAEALYGPYAWERYDIIVLPPSFPFGGMENPRLTFATPTILAGDRSLTALVAHELAHSWSGNLVTNATWNDFWLNEGFTVYFEQRIMESLYGRDYAEMLATLSLQGLKEEIKALHVENPEDTHLKLNLDGRNPDDGMTSIAYDKGYFFLRLLEETVGRPTFDAFLNTYFKENAFKVMDTERFVELLKNNLLDDATWKLVQGDAWIYGPDLPENCPATNPSRFEAVNQALESWKSGAAASTLGTAEWTTHEWLHFITNLPPSLDTAQLADLDNTFRFTTSKNNEILAAWFQHTIRNGYSVADKAVETFLIHVGRRKFLTPTYKALIAADTSKEKARKIYEKARPNYHAVSFQTIDELLQ
jgi:leukotriene-A4 hydrolase